MEQLWTNDKYDMPSGDLEFWARRRGRFPKIAANQNKAPESDQPSNGVKLALKQLVMVAWLAIALGLVIAIVLA